MAGIQVEYAIGGSELIHGLHLEVPIVASSQTNPHTYYEAIILCLIPLLLWCFDRRPKERFASQYEIHHLINQILIH